MNFDLGLEDAKKEKKSNLGVNLVVSAIHLMACGDCMRWTALHKEANVVS